MNGGIIGARNNPNNGLVSIGNRPRGGIWTINDLFAGMAKPFTVLPTGATLWDSLDSSANVTATSGAVVAVSTPRLEGSGALSLTKTSTSVAYCRLQKDSISPTVNFSTYPKMLGAFVFVKDATALSKIRAIKLSAGTQYDSRVFSTFSPFDGRISVGWSRMEIMVEQSRSSDNASFPSLVACDFWLVEVATYNNADTLAEGDVVFDCIYYR